jgi:hypothetical protein
LQSQDSLAHLIAKRLTIFLGAIVFFVTFLFLVNINDVLLADPDTWWHIKTGQDILANFRLPIVDSYSHTYAGHPWIAKEWLSQVLFALSFNLAGWSGVLWLTAIAITSAIAILYFELAKAIHPLLAFVAAPAIVLFCVPVFIARPHVFTFVIAIIFTSRLLNSAVQQRKPEFWLLLSVSLWANLHGSFTLAFVIAGFAFLAMLEKNRLKDFRLTGQWLAFLILCPVASFVNPYGLQPLLINLSFVSGLPVMSLIGEWQPFNAAVAPLIEFGLLTFIFILLVTGVRLSITKTLFLIFTLHMMLSHIRFIYVFFLLVPIIVCREIAELNPKLATRNWAARPRDNIENAVAKFVLPILFGGAIAASVLFWLNAPFSPPPERKIDGALAYVKDHHLDGTVLNSYDVGGQLILNNIKTFIDGRAEQMFTGEFLTNYEMSGKPDGENALADILQKYHIKWAILVPKDLRKDFLSKMPNWKKTYADDYATIFERN